MSLQYSKIRFKQIEIGPEQRFFPLAAIFCFTKHLFASRKSMLNYIGAGHLYLITFNFKLLRFRC